MIRPALLLILLLGGCNAPAGGRYPSLLPRAIEQRSDAEPVREAPSVAADPALDAQLATSNATLSAASATFAEISARARSLTAAARGAAVGTESWLAAQAALAELDAERAQSLTVVADLERLAIDRAAAGLPPYPALDEALAAGQAQLDSQTGAITALQGELVQA